MSALSSNTAPPSGVPGKKLFRKKLKVFNGQQHVMYATTNSYNYTSSVTCMLKSLNWHTVEYRRDNSSFNVLLQNSKCFSTCRPSSLDFNKEPKLLDSPL